MHIKKLSSRTNEKYVTVTMSYDTVRDIHNGLYCASQTNEKYKSIYAKAAFLFDMVKHGMIQPETAIKLAPKETTITPLYNNYENLIKMLQKEAIYALIGIYNAKSCRLEISTERNPNGEWYVIYKIYGCNSEQLEKGTLCKITEMPTDEKTFWTLVENTFDEKLSTITSTLENKRQA